MIDLLQPRPIRSSDIHFTGKKKKPGGICRIFRSTTAAGEEHYVLFDYTRKDPLTREAFTIKPGNFLV